MRRRRLVGKGTKGIPLKFIGRSSKPVVGVFVLVCHLKRHGRPALYCFIGTTLSCVLLLPCKNTEGGDLHLISRKLDIRRHFVAIQDFIALGVRRCHVLPTGK